MKKMLSLVLALAIMISVCGALTAAQAEGVLYVNTSNGKSLNLREAPSTDARVLAQIPFGDEFWTFEFVGNGWVYGHWGGQFGYVMIRYLSDYKPSHKPVSPTAKPTPKEDSDAVKLAKETKSEHDIEPIYIAVRAARASSWVNFRTGPSATTKRITSFPDGKELIANGETTNWYRATDPETGKTGYIHKNYSTKLNRRVTVTSNAANDEQKLGSLNINGAFNLTCKLPADYDLQVVNIRGDKIVASVLSKNIAKPQMYLSIAYDEMYSNVETLNDLSGEELAALEATFSNMNQVEISYKTTGHGTKLLVARETGADTDFVDILAIYKGYFIEFNMTPNPNAASQTLTDAQVEMCIDFLTDINFVPAK